MNKANLVPCFHCGEDCGRNPVIFEEKKFCCNGCKVVYDILKDNKLFTYYELETAPGIKKTDEQFHGKFYYLDEPEIKDALLDFSQGEMSKVTFYIPSIHCSSCIWLLEHLYKLHPGILKSSVNFPERTIYISYNNLQISLREIAELLDSVHYSPSISFDTLKGSPKPGMKRKILYKLGVAGFAFGNIMLLSFPSYFSNDGSTDPEMMRFFQWVNFLLALPVFFYSATEFFSAAFKNLQKKIINVDLPVAIGIIALFSQSVYELIAQSGPGYFDSLAGLVFFLLIGRWYQNKTYASLSFDRDYKSYFPIAVQRQDEESWRAVTLDKVKRGDLLRINNNEIIPADGILKAGNATIDYSFVTGEASPVTVNTGEKIFAGGRQRGTSIQVQVTREVSQSYLTQLWNQEIRPGNKKGLTHLLDYVGKYFTVAILIIGLGALLYWSFREPSKAVFVFTSVLIVACPCALALSAPFGLGTALRLMGKNGLFLRNTSVVESLAKANRAVFDKTGTLTDTQDPQVKYTGQILSDPLKKYIKGLSFQSPHPLSKSVSIFYRDIPAESPDTLEEIPGKGIMGLFGEKIIRLGSGDWMRELKMSGIEAEATDNNGRSTRVYVACNNEVLGNYHILPRYRDGLHTLLVKLSEHMRLWVLSGDGPAEEETLKTIFPPHTDFRFNHSPHQKLAAIRQLQEKKQHNVLMLGDGLNDAGALAEAQTGIAVTNDLRTFVPASDGILKADNLYRLYSYIKISQQTLHWIKASIVLSFLYNFVGLYFAITGALTPVFSAILMPLSSVTVVSFVTFGTLWTGNRILK